MIAHSSTVDRGRPPATPSAAAARDLTKTYGAGDTAVPALRGVTADFRRGTFTAVMGPSGSGKSTFMHCLAGLDRPTGGQAFIGGEDISALGDRQLTRVRRDRIGFVFQSFNLLPTLTAVQNILLPLDLAGRPADPARLAAVVDSLQLGDRLTHRPAELSGGQQQRVAIARALVTGPEVVFADEPTGALDSRTAAALLGFLRRSSRELGQTIVMVTHDPIAAAYADRALLLSDGRIVDELSDPTAETVLGAMRGLAA
ncbi:ABC transporter ATP-binding protein [Actinoplanes sp. NBRC 103695]|uniref:ABC transporter ATP-binding protein n=1 Tax=Actinoplanes sp. NBRC 103695 TaxID=3032202 RepID=UPI0024A1F0D1|nr:ABC transporter ATP-binding protein [Actinoplanes sp. NBRC 103695]GLY95104.1 ABC transporter ATP-binding protein [Actinoplanes sp. NBRC 103695]